MHFDGDFRHLASTDADLLRAKVAELTDEEWSQLSERQNTYDVHSDTQTIPLIFDPGLRHRHPTVHENFARFREYVDPAMGAIRGYFRRNPPDTKRKRPQSESEGYFVRAILVMLSPQSEIAAHVDNGYSLSRAHRVHLPLETNEDVKFGVGDSIRSLPVGALWEINNRRQHFVSNRSPHPRIHLIMDYVIPGEVITDPTDGELVA